MSSSSSVFIIGAGFAGLGAARQLSYDPRFKVTILEGSSKVGGRLYTISSGDDVPSVELGATVLHGEEGNTLYELTKEFNIGTLKSCDRSSSDALFVSSNGMEISHHVVSYYGNIITDIFEELCICSENKDWHYVHHQDDPQWSKYRMNGPSPCVQDYVRKRAQTIIPCKGETYIETETQSSIIEYWLSREAIASGSRNIDVHSYHEFMFPLGDQNIQIKGGYQRLADYLAASLPPETIQFNKEVCQIEWSDHTPSPVSVHCIDGTVYNADHVIVTVSLGVLKQNNLSFTPPLPQSKLDVINKLGFGLIIKVAFDFPEPLLSKQYHKIGLLWQDNERKQFLSSYPWLVNQCSLHCVGSSSVWIAWFISEDAEQVQCLPHDTLSKGITLMLETFLCKSIKKPVHVQSVSWGQDKLFCGSYSYNAIGTSSLEREELATPLNGSTPLQLLFAGEATHSTLYSTTNGAYDTGIREANRLLHM